MMNNNKIKMLIAVIMIIILAGIIVFMINKRTSKKESQSAVAIASVSSQVLEDNLVNEDILVAVLSEETEGEESEFLDSPEANKNILSSNKKVTSINSTSSNSPYYIKVNYQANTVTVYSKDSEGKYTHPCKAMICSTGTATPKSGVYKTTDKYKWGALIGGVYGHYSTRIVGSILFHSVPYTKNNDNGSLEYWEYDKLGTTASAGCVRLTVADCKWIYDNCPSGTQVEFYASSDPGPLGKPSAQKISGASGDLKNWDPTDPHADNPWRNRTTEQQQNNNENNNGQSTVNTNQNNNQQPTPSNNEETNTTIEQQDTNSNNNTTTNTNTTVEDNNNTNQNTTTENNTTENVDTPQQENNTVPNNNIEIDEL